MRKVDQYHRMSRDHCRSVGRLGVLIAELRDSKDWGDDNVEKAVCLRLIMKETEVKIAEKNVSIRRLKRNGAVSPADCVNKEVGGDVTVIREYRGIECCLRISMQKREEFIGELKALGDRQGVAETVRFMKGLQADEMDREVEVKAREKSRFILKLSGYEFLLRCHKEISNDVRLGTEINALCTRLTVIVDERVNFVNELDMLAPEFVSVKMAELIKQIQDKDI
nr:hypothetical protein [Tanacetum cinerariifolium]